jgi:hypothetical protein
MAALKKKTMLSSLEQISVGMAGLSGAERLTAEKQAVRHLIVGNKHVDAALDRMKPSDAGTILRELAAILDQDLRSYYRREITRLFGGARTYKTLPDGRTIPTRSQGTVHKGLSRMTDEPRIAMQALIDSVEWDGLNTLPTARLEEIVTLAKQYLAEDKLNKRFIAEGHRVRRAEAAERAAEEIIAARDPIKGTAERDPRTGSMMQRNTWWRASQNTRALMLAGGDADSVTYHVLGIALRKANSRQLSIEARDNRELEAVMKSLGFKKKDLLTMDYVLENVKLADNTTVELTRGEMMTIYGMTLDEDAREKLINNGWRPARFRHDDTRSIRGTGETYDDRRAASMAIIESVVSKLSDREKRLVEWFAVTKAADWARQANATSKAVSGVSLFQERPHFTLVGSVARQAELPQVEDPASFRAHMVDRMGLSKERQAHTHTLLVRPFLAVVRLASRDMSTYIAWAIPYRDAISLLSRGPAVAAIVQRWGVNAIKDMKESLSYMTYQRGVTDEYNGLQRFATGFERRSAVFILGARATSIIFNRIGGAIMMNARAVQDMGMSVAGPYFLKVLRPPITGIQRLTPKRAQIKEQLLSNGYFWDRWSRNAFRVFGQLTSQRMEMQERAAKTTATQKSLIRNQRWHDFQQWMLSGMASAEIANTIDMWEVLEKRGLPAQVILQKLEEWTRETQNPSTPVESTGVYTDLRKSGMGFIAPFSGQPSVQADQLVAQYYTAKQSGNWKRFAIYAVGLLLVIAVTIMVRTIVRRLSRGEITTPPDDNEKINIALDTVGEALDNIMPVSSKVIEPIARYTASVATGNKSIRPRSIDDTSLFGQAGDAVISVFNTTSSAVENEKLTDAQMERLFLSTHQVLGMVLPLPTGGVEQFVRVAAGASGHTVGVKQKEEPKRRRNKRQHPRKKR